MITDATRNDLIACLHALAAAQPQAPALIAPNAVPMTFAGIATRIDIVARRLREWGIGRGDVVAWPALDRPATALAFAALPGASTMAPLAPGWSADAYTSLLQRLRPKAIALPEGLEHPSREAARQLAIAELDVVATGSGLAGDFELRLDHARPSLDGAAVVDAAAAYVVATSGTTTQPKLVPLGHAQVMAAVRFARARLAIGPGDVCGHVTPMHLGNGLRASFLIVVLNGGAVSILPEADVASLLTAVESGAITCASASFTLMRELLQVVEGRGRVEPGRLRFLRTASGGLLPGEIGRLEQIIGVPLVTGLSSTEAGLVTHQALPPVSRSPGSVGPPTDCEVRLVDDAGHPVAPGDVGEIAVRGPQVFDGYVGETGDAPSALADGWYRMGDLGRIDAAGELHLVGRVKDIVNRGGEKFSPSAIEDALRGVAGVVDAAAFGIPHPRLGEELVAAVVRTPGSAVHAAEIARAVEAVLGSRSAPRQIWFVPSLPRNEAGKLQRRALPQWVADHAVDTPGAKSSAGERPRNPLEIALSALWSAVLLQPAVPTTVNFFVLGGDSLRAARLLAQVRAAFGVDVPLRLMYAEDGTVAGMARLIEARRADATRAD